MNRIQSKSPLVTCEWLENNLDVSGLVLLDGAFVLPNQGRKAIDEYEREHIPGAQFFDIDLIADRESDLPHMLPSAEVFARSAGDLGIDNQTKIVVYDSNSFIASARVWWTFRVFGYANIFVLNGGLKRWKSRGGIVDSEHAQRASKQFNAVYHPELVCDLEGMRELMTAGSHKIIDARSPSRFSGTEKEVRLGLRSGHIPGSVNLHYNTLVNPETNELAALEELETLYRNVGADGNRPIVTTCGSGVTASILALGLFCLGYENVPVYDGSWTEWGGRMDTPIETVS